MILHKRLFTILILIIAWHTSLVSGMDEKQLLNRFESYVIEQKQAWGVPGVAIGIVKGDKVIFQKGFGERGLSTHEPVDENTVFQIGSLSKAFTAALIGIAVDKKQLRWEDKVIQHYPLFRLNSPWATVEFEVQDLLAQRSGLAAYAGDTQAFLGFSAEDILFNLRYFQPQTSFRANYAYQNSFFLVAAKLLELKNKRPYAEELKREIFEPLGMSRTTVSLEDYLKEPNRAQWLMRTTDGSTQILDDNFRHNNWNYILAPAGGINSSVKDMTKWLLLQINQGQYAEKKLLSTQAMQKIRSPMIYAATIGASELYYALGWVYKENSPYPIIWHDGSTLGVYNVAAFIPQEKLGIVILSNVRNTQLALALALQFFDYYFDKPDQDWSRLLLKKKSEEALAKKTISQPKPPSQDYAPFVGQYHNAVYGEVTVKNENNNLTLTIGKTPETIPLKPWQDSIFLLEWPDTGDEPTQVLFFPNSDGVVDRLRIEQFAKEGSGDFQKK